MNVDKLYKGLVLLGLAVSIIVIFSNFIGLSLFLVAGLIVFDFVIMFTLIILDKYEEKSLNKKATIHNFFG